MFKYETIISPLDQFEIRNLLGIDTPLLGNINLSITNIGLYMTIATFLAFYFSILATNHAKIAPNKWSLTQETLYATIHSIVINQINNKKGQVYFPFMYALFIFILINNLIGMVLQNTDNLCDCITLSSLTISNKKVSGYSHTKFNKYSTNNQESSKNNGKGILVDVINPYHLTGFIDGEGCFSILFIKIVNWQ